MCPPFVSLLVSALFRWPCSISIHLSPRSVTAGVRPFPLATQHFYSFVSQVCYCWCPPFSTGHAAFLFICFPGLSLVALFRWPCSISIHLSPRCVTAGVRPFLLAMQHVAFLFMCLPGLSLLSAFFRCLPSLFLCLRSCICVRLVSLLVPLCFRSCLPFRWSLRPACLPSVIFCPSVSGLVSLFVGHCVRLVSLLFPFVSLLVPLLVIVSALSPVLCPPCLPSVSLCVRSCLPSCLSLCRSCLPSVS